MNEGAIHERPQQPTLEELDGVSGREIEGIRDTIERFSSLAEGSDFQVIARNDHVTCERSLSDFIVFINPHAGSKSVTIEAPHWRAVNDHNVKSSVVLDRTSASTGREFFYSVSTKGVGYLKPSAKGLDFDHYSSWAIPDNEGVNDQGYKVLGLISREEATGGRLIQKSEELITAGLRTELYWGMVELRSLPFHGAMMPVEELRRRSVISPRADYVPYEVVRLFKVSNRIAEASQSDERRRQLFERAFEIFNKESQDKELPFPVLRIGNPEEEQMFFQEFFLRMGKNIAILLNLGLDHGYLHSANVTLAAEIADVGTISHWRDEKTPGNIRLYSGVRRSHIKDMRDACYGLRMLLKAARQAGLNIGSRHECATAFLDGFERELDHAKLQEQQTNSTSAALWMRKILSSVVVQGENLAPLLHHEIEEWPIHV